MTGTPARCGAISRSSASAPATSVSAIVGTGLGGGVIVDGAVVKGRKGFGGELGHVLIPYQSIPRIEGLKPECNCGRIGDLESLCSLTAIRRTLLPFFLDALSRPRARRDRSGAGRQEVRGLAERGDAMCREIFRVQARALGLFFDEMVNTFDPDALIVGGGAIETGREFQGWVVGRDSRRDARPAGGAGGHPHSHHAQRRHRRRLAPRRRQRRVVASLARRLIPLIRPGPAAPPPRRPTTRSSTAARTPAAACR